MSVDVKYRTTATAARKALAYLQAGATRGR